jgi:HEAT repeat protein
MPQLLTMLKEGQPFQRRPVVQALGRVGEPAVPTLIELLKAPEPFMRMSALDALRTMGPDAKKAAPALIELVFKETSPVYRRTAVNALAFIDPEKMTDLFARVKKSGDVNQRLNTYQALYVRAKKGTVTVLLPPKVVVPLLIDGTKDASPSVRLAAVQGLGSMRENAKDAVPALTALAEDPEASVRNAATQALVQIRGK